MLTTRPQSDLDLFTEDALLNPYENYRELRDMAAAVWMSKYEMYALARYKDVREALKDWETFSSARGVAMNDQMNEALRGITLCTDTPEHDVLRGIVGRPLAPAAIRELTERIAAEADALVERVASRGTFDAVAELAWYLPLTIVSNLVGLPDAGRNRMLDWAAATFNCIGPVNQRTLESFPVIEEMVTYAMTEGVPGKLKPGSWGAALFEAAERGEIPREKCAGLLLDYLGPSLDTTIFAISSAVMLFGENPDQWTALRSAPGFISRAVDEVLRTESPIQCFTRYVTKDHDIEDVALPKGSRVIVLYGSANRDERKWQDPERFDIHRKAADHLGFGVGPHSCLGMHLAKLEIQSVIAALAKRVERFELGDSKRVVNNALRGFQCLQVTVH